MRFEAKNHSLKRLVGLNFKNVPKTVAVRHQYNMCLNLLAPPGVRTRFLYSGDVIRTGTNKEEVWFTRISMHVDISLSPPSI